MLPVVDWGTRDYADSLAAMRAMRRDRRAGRIPDTLILVQHPPVITVGVQGDDGEVLPPDVPVIRVERGGKSTYHGPGQLVGYPIVDLEPGGRNVRGFVGEVENLIVDSVAPFGIRGERLPQRRGVWVGSERKIASVGIAVEEWVTFHGFALNVSTDLSKFAAFHPCGFSPDVMTSVEREIGRPVTVAEVIPFVRAAWEARFGPGQARNPSFGSVVAAPVP